MLGTWQESNIQVVKSTDYGHDSSTNPQLILQISWGLEGYTDRVRSRAPSDNIKHAPFDNMGWFCGPQTALCEGNPQCQKNRAKGGQVHAQATFTQGLGGSAKAQGVPNLEEPQPSKSPHARPNLGSSCT